MSRRPVHRNFVSNDASEAAEDLVDGQWSDDLTVAGALDVIGTGSFAGAAASLSQGNVQVGVDSGGDPGGELMFHTDDYVGLRCAHSGALPLAVKPSGNVGIGTTAPAVALDVIGTGSFAGAAASQSQGNVQIGVDSGGDPGGEVMFHTDDYIGIRCADSGALPFAVKPSGNVGIGDVAPGTQLQMSGTAPYVTLKNSTSENTEGGCESKVIFEDHADVTLAQIEGSHSGSSDDTKGKLILSTHSGSALTAALTISDEAEVRIGSGSARGIIESNGNQDLLIRTGNSTTGTINITDAADGNIAITPNGTGIILVGSGSGDAAISSSGAHNLILATNSGTNSSTLTITDNENGDVTCAMDGTGAFNILAESGEEATLQLTADAGDSNGDFWQVHATDEGHFLVETKASGSYADMLDLHSAGSAAPGGGFDRTNGVLSYVTKLGAEIVTTLHVDLGAAVAESTTNEEAVIGEDGVGDVWITQLSTATNGVIYKVEMSCIEAPTTGQADIDLVGNSGHLDHGDLYDSSGTHTVVIAAGGAWATGMSMQTGSRAALVNLASDYLYLACGAAGTDGEYGAGQFIIKLYGAAARS